MSLSQSLRPRLGTKRSFSLTVLLIGITSKFPLAGLQRLLKLSLLGKKIKKLKKKKRVIRKLLLVLRKEMKNFSLSVLYCLLLSNSKTKKSFV